MNNDDRNCSLGILSIEVAYAGVSKQIALSLQLPIGSKVQDAIIISNILNLFPELGKLEELKGRIGIFGESVNFERLLQGGERVEIYRHLHFDPKATRRIKAKKAKKAEKIALELKKRVRNKRNFQN